jgi:hypothetical protein
MPTDSYRSRTAAGDPIFLDAAPAIRHIARRVTHRLAALTPRVVVPRSARPAGLARCPEDTALLRTEPVRSHRPAGCAPASAFLPENPIRAGTHHRLVASWATKIVFTNGSER